MPFGIKSAQEVFQKRMSQLFGDLEGVETDIDDILVWGTTKSEHDQRLRNVLKRCEEVNLTLNPEKCAFGVSEVTYIGHKLSANGIRPDQEKVRAIKEMPPPIDKKGVERLLGTVNYLAKFIPNMSTITAPIRDLLRKENEFCWTQAQETAFLKVKETLSETPVLAFYDVNKPVLVTCDASKSGLGALLMQNNKPIAYASRALTDAETRYAQIEKELLAVVFALERFNQYIYGKQVEVESDHKPLEIIVKKPLMSAPPRLQRMLLRLQRYDYKLRYKPGKEMILADTLSRAYIHNTEQQEDFDKELSSYIHSILANIPATDTRLEEIRVATAQDEKMQSLKSAILDGWPEKQSQVPEPIRIYWNFRDELSISEEIILKGVRIVIPTSLRPEMLNRIHTGHMGIERSKQRARDVMFWPGMGEDIAKKISSCTTCLEYRNSNPKEPMIPGPIPTRPWEMVATDLFHWNKTDYLLMVDYYSRFVEISQLPDTTSKTVIAHTKSILARHGIPSVIRSDNGPQYTSIEYQQFAKQWGFTHVTTSPYHPQANGLAEKSVQTMKKLLNKAKRDNKDPYLSLLEHRNTPIDGIASPAQIAMSRRLRSTVPTTSAQLKSQVIDPKLINDKLQSKQQQQKSRYDVGAHQLPSVTKGEKVRLQIQGQWQPATIIEKASTPRSYYVNTSDGSILRRNRRHLMKTGEIQTDIPTPNTPKAADPQKAPGSLQKRERKIMEQRDNHIGDPPDSIPIKTSSGREIRRPKKLLDYV